MWSMANPAITDFVFDAPAPIISEYDFNVEEQKLMYDNKNEAFQKASNL